MCFARLVFVRFFLQLEAVTVTVMVMMMTVVEVRSDGEAFGRASGRKMLVFRATVRSTALVGREDSDMINYFRGHELVNS